MEALNTLKCVPCRGGEPPLRSPEIQKLQPQVREWEVVDHQGVPRLERTFRFENFREALEFTDRIGAIAEEQGHHPVLVTQWGKVKVSWWTHKIKGLHKNDFIMAAKTDALFSKSPGKKGYRR